MKKSDWDSEWNILEKESRRQEFWQLKKEKAKENFIKNREIFDKYKNDRNLLIEFLISNNIKNPQEKAELLFQDIVPVKTKKWENPKKNKKSKICRLFVKRLNDLITSNH